MRYVLRCCMRFQCLDVCIDYDISNIKRLPLIFVSRCCAGLDGVSGGFDVSGTGERAGSGYAVKAVDEKACNDAASYNVMRFICPFNTYISKMLINIRMNSMPPFRQHLLRVRLAASHQ